MDRFLATVQIGVTLLGTLAGVLGGYLASATSSRSSRSGSWRAGCPRRSLASTMVGLGIVYVELVLGELVPKALALRYTRAVALLVSLPFRWLARVSRWLVAILAGSTRAVLRLFGIREAGPRTFVSEEEIKHLVKEGRQQGVLDESRDGADPQRVRVHGHAGAQGDGARGPRSSRSTRTRRRRRSGPSSWRAASPASPPSRATSTT